MKLKTSFREALRLAQEHAMEQDENVFLYGLDVGDHKETFRSTVGLKKKFGEKRVFATPLSEDSLCGLGIGAAIAGLRPVNIHIRADFLLLCMNQLSNIAGNVAYYSNGHLSCPLTIRAIIGRGWGQGAQHSKEIYQLFQSIPGIKIVVPSSVQDAYSLLKASIFDNNPVVFFEHRWLYDVEGELDTEKDVEYGKTKIVKEGTPERIHCCGWDVIEALKTDKTVVDHRGINHTCLLPPVPTCRNLETEYYKLKYGSDNVDTYENRFRGPF
jgi:pyruvate dehydrogenase E1 component beta subunit